MVKNTMKKCAKEFAEKMHEINKDHICRGCAFQTFMMGAYAFVELMDLIVLNLPEDLAEDACRSLRDEIIAYQKSESAADKSTPH